MNSPRVLCLAVLAVSACAPASQQTAGSTATVPMVSLPASNPFAAPSTLPYQVPDFSRIRDVHYEPAFAAGMKQNLAETDAIANQSAAPTFDNTIVAMERSGELLTRVNRAFNAVTGANTNDSLQAIQERVAPKLAAHGDAIYLNDKLYQRVKSIYDRRDALGLTGEQKTLVELYNRNFVRAGANLSEADKVKLRAFNQEESKLVTDFQARLLAATKAGALVLDNVSDLEGMSAGEIAAAADAAKQRGLTGKWVISLQNTTQHPAQVSLKNRAVRQRLFVASTTRASRGDANDTRGIVKRLAELRADKAKLLGFPNFSAYALDNQMSKTSENATKLLTNLVPAATAKARSEIAAMQAVIDKENGGFKLAPWDWQYYAEQVRKAQFALDESG